jgi:hypothetical protein
MSISPYSKSNEGRQYTINRINNQSLIELILLDTLSFMTFYILFTRKNFCFKNLRGILTTLAPTMYPLSFNGKERNYFSATYRRSFMIHKLFVAFIVVVAVIVGVCAIGLPREEIPRLVMFRDFFDVSLPILAVGALVKYLCSCGGKCYCGDCSKTCTRCATKTV